MLTIVLTLVGLVVGFVTDEESWLLGMLAGLALGQALAAKSASNQLKQLHAQLSQELQRQGQTLQRVDGGLLWMWNDWQRARAQVPASPAAEPASTQPDQPPVAQAPMAQTPAAQSIAAQQVAPQQAATPHAAPQPSATEPGAVHAASGPRAEDVAATSHATAPSRLGQAQGQSPHIGAQTPAPATPAAFATSPAMGHAARNDIEARIRELIFGGNTIARAGILVLLVGVVLLLKWAADNSLFPIEARMGSAALVGAALTVIGYRLRARKPTYGALLQGGGTAALYLTVFFSFHSYQLLPAILAFALLAAISLSSCVLAAVQNSMPLIVIGALGGFMAPILASTGSGNHVALFSYYLLLNSALLSISIYKGWRPVALLAFVFTFGVGSTWGALRYDAEHFWTTEPFLLAFGLMFAAAPVLTHSRARKISPDSEASPKLSSSLTFGTPLTVLILQGLLLKDEALQMALALVGFGFAYLGGATLLLQRSQRAFLPFAESFLAIGVGFGTLAIPYALSNHSMTSAAWALEGAGMVWVGLRQNRRGPRWFGTFLQLAASASLLLGYAGVAGIGTGVEHPATHGLLGASLVAASCYFVALYCSRQRALIPTTWGAMQALLPLGLGLGLLFALGAMNEQLPDRYLPGAQFALLGVVAIGLELLSAKLAYDVGRWPPLLSFVITPVLALVFLLGTDIDPFTPGWLLAWPSLLVAMTLSAVRFVPTAPKSVEGAIAALFLSVSVLFGVLAARACSRLELAEAWSHAAFTSVIAISLLATTGLRGTGLWPWSRHQAILIGPTALALVTLTLAALVVQTTIAGGPSPLPYLPIVNPVELAHSLALLACWVYLLRAYPSTEGNFERSWARATAAVAFVVFNSVLARSVHHFTAVEYDFGELWESPTMHWVLSAAWTVVAVSLIFLSSRRGWRTIWITAANLMALTVIKLFLVDLSRQSTVAKIVTFMAVGVALLVVGFVSPLPPKPAEKGPQPPSPKPGHGGASTQGPQPGAPLPAGTLAAGPIKVGEAET